MMNGQRRVSATLVFFLVLLTETIWPQRQRHQKRNINGTQVVGFRLTQCNLCMDVWIAACWYITSVSESFIWQAHQFMPAKPHRRDFKPSNYRKITHSMRKRAYFNADHQSDNIHSEHILYNEKRTKRHCMESETDHKYSEEFCVWC